MKKIFLDTDIFTDCDDMGALAMLLQYMADGKAECVGITHCTGSPYGVPAIDAVCREFGFAIPIGTCNDPDFMMHEGTKAFQYTLPISKWFPNSYPEGTPQNDALDVFTHALENAEEPVTLVTIGFFNNVERFMRNEKAFRLMNEKVDRIVSMAGDFSTLTPEYNVRCNVPAAQYVVNHWKKPMDFCPFETYLHCLTGKCLLNARLNPVSLAYMVTTGGSFLRPSWDLGTIMAAVEGETPSTCWSQNGDVEVQGSGRTVFTPNPAGNRRIMLTRTNQDETAAEIEQQLNNAVSAMQRNTGRN